MFNKSSYQSKPHVVSNKWQYFLFNLQHYRRFKDNFQHCGPSKLDECRCVSLSVVNLLLILHMLTWEGCGRKRLWHILGYCCSATANNQCRLVDFFFSFLVAPTLGSLLPLLEHRAEFPQFLNQGQSIGLLGQVISSSQGLYLYTNTEKHKH
jgi:hypothetical protein